MYPNNRKTKNINEGIIVYFGMQKKEDEIEIDG